MDYHQKIDNQIVEMLQKNYMGLLVYLGLRLVLLVVPYELLKLGCWVVMLESFDLSL